MPCLAHGLACSRSYCPLLLSISLFDTEERRFFGRTWESAEVPLPRGSLRSPVDIDHDVDAYVHSSLQIGIWVILACANFIRGCHVF